MSYGTLMIGDVAMKPIKNRRGFTLLELLVVIGLIGLLMSLLLPAILKSKDSGQDKRIEAGGDAIVTAINAYRLRYHKWPADKKELENGKDAYYGTDPQECTSQYDYIFYTAKNYEHWKNNGWKPETESETRGSTHCLASDFAGDNHVVFDRLKNPPDGSTAKDEPLIDMDDFVTDRHGNVLKSADGEQYRIIFDFEGNYYPSGGVLIEGFPASK